jgi:hypothetical protein
VYAVALWLTLAWCLRRRHVLLTLLAITGGMLVGFIATYGFWGLVLWKRFGSPVFPFFNGVLKSEYWDSRTFFDSNFKRTAVQWLTLPFQLAYRGMIASETNQRDARMAVLVVLVFILALSAARQWRSSGLRAQPLGRVAMPQSIVLLIAFTGFSYLVWLIVFRVYRYTIPIELVASLLLVLAMRAALAGSKYQTVIAAVVLGAIVATTAFQDLGRIPLRAERYIEVKVPSIPPDSLVLILSGEPVAYIVPFIESRPRIVRPISNFTGPDHHNRLQREITSVVYSQRGPLYVIRYLDTRDHTEDEALAFYGLKRVDERCQTIESNLEGGRQLGICPVVRDSQFRG